MIVFLPGFSRLTLAEQLPDLGTNTAKRAAVLAAVLGVPVAIAGLETNQEPATVPMIAPTAPISEHIDALNQQLGMAALAGRAGSCSI